MEDIYNIRNRYKKIKVQFLQRTSFEIGVGKKKTTVKINPKNKALANKWIIKREEDLQNQNGYDKNAEIRYNKTMYKEISTFMPNVLLWFNHLNLEKLTAEELKEIYKKLEQGELETIKGNILKPVSRKDYYSKVFKGGFFKFIGKEDIAKKVIQRRFSLSKEVKYLSYDNLKKILMYTKKVDHRLAFLLLFDTGVEITALLHLKKKNFQYEEDEKGDFDFKLNVGEEEVKKGRQARYMYLQLGETKKLLKEYLDTIKESDKLFNFKQAALWKALKLVVRKYQIKTSGVVQDLVTIKDFRSGCASYMYGTLNWSVGDIKDRLGHSPSSTAIDVYINYLAKDKKQQVQKSKKVNYELLTKDYKILTEKYDRLRQEFNTLKEENKETNERLDFVETVLKQLPTPEDLEVYLPEELLPAYRKQVQEVYKNPKLAVEIAKEFFKGTQERKEKKKK